ncbi:hypothetical protein WA556_004448 [Blastocystis sp. ATCC 50177/Nand II]
MSTRIGMDEAIIQLKEMFPTVDEDVIALVLTENGNSMDKAIASLLILSGDENPELVKTVEKGDFVVTDEVDRELVELEQQYGINLHRTWHTRLPRDLLVFKYKVVPQEDNTNHYYFAYGVGGPGFIYYNPTSKDVGASLSALGKALKEKWTEFRNKKKGYTLTKVTED